MHVRFIAILLAASAVPAPLSAGSPPPHGPATCSRGVLEGELNAGKPYEQAIGNGLRVYFQAIASGWILRVLPTTEPTGEHDYAELATPPYQSVTPLSISTDFAFRAQDAVGWNPRRFRFATGAAPFHDLEQAYQTFIKSGTNPAEAAQAGLSRQIARTAEATFTIVDSRLSPGTADQWRMAAAVASHFSETAHTLVPEPNGTTSPLGRLVWLRFRLELDLPRGFSPAPGLHLEPRICTAP